MGDGITGQYSVAGIPLLRTLQKLSLTATKRNQNSFFVMIRVIDIATLGKAFPKLYQTTSLMRKEAA